jgi:uncharacterized protein (DUF2236 family)
MKKGLYQPDDTLWQVNRELSLLLSGPRALLLEVAHPAVAAGVAQHSNFRRNPLKRLFRTVGMMQRMSFGDPEAVRKAARSVNHCHRPVEGTITEHAGPYQPGMAYSADDPALRLWVHATLVDSSIEAYNAFVRPLDDDERHAFYADSRAMGRMFGIPPGMLPATYADFRAYFADMLASDTLTVGQTGRDIADALFALPVIGPLGRWSSFAGLGLLPARLRADFGFAWSDAHQTRWDRLAKRLRTLRRLTPDVLAAHPQATIAELRWRMAAH